jgi:hypothetical protein
MADLIEKDDTSHDLSDEEIDNIVIQQLEDDLLWDSPIYVRKAKSFFLSIPFEIAERAIFFAKVHKERGIEEWLKRIIRERIEMEESVFNAIKHEFKNK